MKRISKWIKKNKLITFLLAFFIIFFVVLLFLIIDLLFSNHGGSYGDRLEGINNVPIKNDTISLLKNSTLEDNKVENISINVNGRIINILIDLKNNIEIEVAKNIALKTLSYFTTEEKLYYDFQYYLTCKTNSDSEIYPTMGYKSKNTDTIVWLKK